MRCDFDRTDCLPKALPFGISKYDRKHERWPATPMGPPVSAIPQVGCKTLPAEKQADRQFQPALHDDRG
jgi:hypothetical protein